MLKEYVKKQQGVYRIKDTRISLDSIVYAFLRGETPESIAQALPLLTLEQVYGSLTYYLANKAKIDAYLKESDSEYEAMRKAAQEKDPMFYQKLAEARLKEELA